MQELHAHFQKAGYRGSILDVDTEEAIRLYQKVGYQKFTQELQTQLLPNSNVSQLKWTEVNVIGTHYLKVGACASLRLRFSQRVDRLIVAPL